MKAIIYYEHDWQWPRFFSSCKRGLEKLGYSVDTYWYQDTNKTLSNGEMRPANVVVTWGMKTFALDLQKWAKENNLKHIVGERAYLGERINTWTSIGLGGLNGEADFNNESSDSERFEKYFSQMVKPPLDNDGYILIAGQVAGDASLREIGNSPPYADWIDKVRTQTDRQIVFREHPDTKKKTVLSVEYDSLPSLEESLSKTKLLITYNSNSAVIAILNGIPAITMNRKSMAWPVTKHDLEKITEIYLPDRTQWLYNLSYTQWLQEEISSGEPLERLLNNGRK